MEKLASLYSLTRTLQFHSIQYGKEAIVRLNSFVLIDPGILASPQSSKDKSANGIMVTKGSSEKIT